MLEDDPYGQVRYEGEAQPLMHELEGGERVTFTSSFSKTVAPGLRVGYFVVAGGTRRRVRGPRGLDDDLAAACCRRRRSTSSSSRGAFEPNLERIRGLLRARKDAMLSALEREMPGAVTWSHPEGGYFLWVDFGDGVDAADLLARATAARGDVRRVAPISSRPALGGASAARFAFSYETPERIAEGVALLASLL